MAQQTQMKSMPKTYIADALGTKCLRKRKEMLKVLEALAELALEEVTNNGMFTIPGIVTIKKRYKPARKAGKKIFCGKVLNISPKPGYSVVKAFPLFAFKKQLP